MDDNLREHRAALIVIFSVDVHYHLSELIWLVI